MKTRHIVLNSGKMADYVIAIDTRGSNATIAFHRCYNIHIDQKVTLKEWEENVKRKPDVAIHTPDISSINNLIEGLMVARDQILHNMTEDLNDVLEDEIGDIVEGIDSFFSRLSDITKDESSDNEKKETTPSSET